MMKGRRFRGVGVVIIFGSAHKINLVGLEKNNNKIFENFY